MHRLNGVNLATAIHTEATLAARVVLMTEEGDAVDLAELEAGASLSKPIHREDLRASLVEGTRSGGTGCCCDRARRTCCTRWNRHSGDCSWPRTT